MSQVPADIADFLGRVVPFDQLSSDTVERIAAQLRIRYFRRGEAIAVFDPPGRNGLHIVRKGAVALLDENERTLEHRGEGELFGHGIAFDPPVGRYSVAAFEDTLVWELPQQRLDRLVAAEGVLARFLADRPGARLAAGVDSKPARTLADLGLREPVTTPSDRSIGDCARLMAQHRISCLPVLEDGRLAGIVTDRDLRNRVLARDLPPQTAVGDVMTPSPSTVPMTAPPDQALVEMMRLGIHHLPVVDGEGRLAAVISSGDLMQTRRPDPVRLVRDIGRAGDIETVAKLARQGPGLLAGLVRAGTEVTGIGRMAGRITDACTGRLIELAEEALGQAPMAWTWLAFGSQARLEQGLVSDQDNGLLLASNPDPDAEAYFRRLAKFVCDGLDACGYIYCPGGVMAKGEWRMSREAWRGRFDEWMREPDPKSVMHCSIFFDMRAVRGDRELAEDLHREVLEQAARSDIFRRFLSGESLSHRPPLGMFRQFVQERGGERSRGLNLKQRGVIPIVDLARVHALEGALTAVHSEERIHSSGEAGLMTASDAEDLVHALRFIGGVRLRHQVDQLERGEKPDHLVDPSELSSLHRRYLRSAFSIVTTAQRALAQHYML